MLPTPIPKNYPEALSLFSFTSIGPQRYNFECQPDILKQTESLRHPLEKSDQGNPLDLGLNLTRLRNTHLLF